MAENGVACSVSDNHGTLGCDLKGLVVAACEQIMPYVISVALITILLSLLSHEANIGDMSSGGPVELSILLAILDDRVVHRGVASVRDDALNLNRETIVTSAIEKNTRLASSSLSSLFHI